MTYLSLEDVKKHLNLDEEFTADDTYISALADAAEELVSKYIDYPLTELLCDVWRDYTIKKDE